MGRRFATEEGAQQTAEKYGAAAVPFLIEMFQTQDAEVGGARKSKIAFYLGKFRDTRAVQPMVDFIESPLPQEMTEDQLGAILGTMMGLGFIGDEVSLEYLKRLASEDYWLNRPVHPRVPEVSNNYPYHREGGMSEQDTRGKFREYALEGLGLAGNKKAIEILEELKEGAAKDMVGGVNVWLREAKRRRKDGPPWTWVHYDKYGRRYRVTP